MKLWGIQQAAVERIAARHAVYLAWRMGLGKSRAVVAYVEQHRPRSVLILCPASVVGVWPLEFEKVGSAVRVVPLRDGSVADRLERARANWLMDTVVYVTNYEAILHEPLKSAFLRPEWDLVVFDEAHRIKSPTGKQFKWCRRLNSKKFVALSGTPAPHSPLDLWSQLEAIKAGVFPDNFFLFRARYAVMGGYRVNGRPVQVVGFRDQEHLADRLKVVMDRQDTPPVELPPITHQTIPLELPPSARSVYDRAFDDLVLELGDAKQVLANVLAKLAKCRQIANGHVIDASGTSKKLHDAKARALADILDAAGEAEPVVVFCSFRADIDQITEAAGGRPVLRIVGGHNDVGPRLECSGSPAPVVAVQIQAGGVGIDLSRSCYCVLWDKPFNLGDYEQALARLNRQGQTRPVTYYHLVAENTVDVSIGRALGKRAASIRELLEHVRTDKSSDEPGGSDAVGRPDIRASGQEVGSEQAG